MGGSGGFELRISDSRDRTHAHRLATLARLASVIGDTGDQDPCQADRPSGMRQSRVESGQYRAEGGSVQSVDYTRHGDERESPAGRDDDLAIIIENNNGLYQRRVSRLASLS